MDWLADPQTWIALLTLTVLEIVLEIHNMVFSLNPVITAVGMANRVEVMTGAILLAVVFMILFSGTIDRFIDWHPTIRMLALSILLLIGVTLITDGFHQHVPKGCICFAMAFSVFVEALSLRARQKPSPPVLLRTLYPRNAEVR
jgi:predicted tellurium resistance membrane protein TerC